MASFTTEPRTPTLRTLLRQVFEGTLLIPRFQRRGLLWDANRRLELFDSVYRGFPIGSLLVWQTKQNQLRTRDRVGLLPARQRMDASGDFAYLLDGHQRVSVLYTALAPAFYESPPTLDLEEESTDFRWPICFDLRATSGNPFVQSPRGERPKHLIPLDRLFDAQLLDEVKDELRDAGGTREERNRVIELGELFRSTQIPVVPVITERLEEATVSFQRVNSGGVRMDETDMVHALSWKTDFDLDEVMDEAMERLKEVGWGDLPRSDLLGVVKLRLGMTIYKTKPEDLARAIGAKPSIIKEATDAVLALADTLRPFGIHGPASLPYTAQAVLLASGRVPLDDANMLVGWIARTGFTERFAGATDTTFNAALEELNGVLQSGARWGIAEVDPVTRFDFRAARCKLLSHILATEAGTPERVAELGAEALHPLIPTQRAKPLTSTVANRFVLPPSELPALRQALKGWDGLAFGGQMVDVSFADLYANQDYEGALRHRLAEIDALEAAWAKAVNVIIRPRSD